MTMLDNEATHRSSASRTPGWLSPASYWQPAHIVTSAWLEHAPFAFWLVAAMHPRSIVELGTHFGFSFFVFSEAARRLDLDVEIVALDTWEGDDQAGYYEEDVYESVKAVVDRDYSRTSRLVRGYFAQSRADVRDQSVDLLHIDGRHGYDDVKEDFEQWVGAVRHGGVVLFHDIAEHDRDFGVWRLWEELSSRHPSFEFTHGHGLGVLAVGPVRIDVLNELFTADADEVARIRAEYERLGARITRQAQLEAMPAEIDSLHDTVAGLTTEIARLNGQIAQREDEVRAYQRSTSWRVTRPLRTIGGLVRRREQ